MSYPNSIRTSVGKYRLVLSLCSRIQCRNLYSLRSSKSDEIVQQCMKPSKSQSSTDALKILIFGTDRKLYHNRIKYLMYRLRDLRRIIPTATTGKNGIRLMRAKTLICILLTK